MVRNALRKELTEILALLPEGRKPALRRSLREEWLYAADVPVISGGDVPAALRKALTGADWEYLQEGDWLQLRKPAYEPPEGWYAGPFGPEAACCLSLLDRHPARSDEPADPVQRKLIKAGEEGKKAYEETCAALHREWAERLRQGRPLPGISSHYFKT